MPTAEIFDPLFGAAPNEIPLPNAPLCRAVVQVQFTPVMRLRSQDYIASFQDSIRSRYPNVVQERIEIEDPNGSSHSDVIWRFDDGQGAWRTSVGSTFTALEARKYSSRQDFIARLREVIDALANTTGPLRPTRVGVRYVDHVRSPHVDQIAEMLRPEMTGVAVSSLSSNVQHAVNEMVCRTIEGQLLTRWGVLPPHATHDPGVLDSVPERSWFLDIDAFAGIPRPHQPLDGEAICNLALALATRCYSFFRWAVTERFLAVYGGKL